VLIDDGVVGRFGAALAWATRQLAASLDVIVDGSPSAPGIVARRAACFADPPAIWVVAGTTLTPAEAAPPVPEGAEAPPESLTSLLDSHGLEVIWEHGVLRGEVLGLEVARTVGPTLEVGVGRHDRSARFEMRPGESVSAALSEAASAVRELRRPGAPRHPANTLARSRWLRALLVRSPEQYGFADLVPVAPPLPWFDLPEAGAAPGLGVSLTTGAPVVVVCSVGVDLDLVPTAADCRLLYEDRVGPDAEVWLVVPSGDDLPVTRSLAARLSPPAHVLTVPRGWESG
jgi:hypothetical protein